MAGQWSNQKTHNILSIKITVIWLQFVPPQHNYSSNIKDHGSQITPVGAAAATAAKSLQSCPTLCGPRDGSPPGSPIPGILQARTLEWVAISFSNA